MATRRSVVKRKGNRIPINFVTPSRNRKSGFTVQTSVMAVSIPNDEDSGPSAVTDYDTSADSVEVEDSTTSGEAVTTA